MPLEHLPNAPLIEAIMEIRFPAEPSILSRMDEYYGKVRNDYPQVFVPNPNPTVAQALLPWQFKSPDGQRFIAISINSFSFHVLDYKHYKDFSSSALPLACKFCELFSIGELKRIGTRYVNCIIVLRGEDGTIPVRRFLNFGFDLPDIVPKNELEDIHVQFASRMGNGRLLTIIHHERESEDQPERLVFDLDFSLDKDVHADSLDKHMNAAHACIEDVFREFVSDSYMQYMRGETL